MLTKVRLFLSPWWVRGILGAGIGLIAWGALLTVANSTLCPAPVPPPEVPVVVAPLLEQAQVVRPKHGKKLKPKIEQPVATSVTPVVPAPVPFDQAQVANAVRVVFGALAGVVSLILLTSFAKADERRRKREAVSAARNLAAAQKHNERIEYYRANPLIDHTLCTTCGWIGRFRSNAPTYSGTKAVGGVAAVGGTGIAALGCGGSIVGIVLIVIGIPLLFFFGLGLIPIILGVVMLSVGGTAAAAGTTVAASGASMASGAANAAKSAATAPNQCPQCKNVGLIPALSPMGIHHITNTPTVSTIAEIEAQKVIDSLPHVVDVQPLPELNC